jgi:hypothetical protein
MKVRELLERLDDVITHLEIALVTNQQRVFESPYTSYEFTQRAIELQEDLDDLKRLREELSKLDPEEDVEAVYPKEEVEELLKMLELLKRANAHLY